MNILQGLCFVFSFLVVIDWQYAAGQNCPKFDDFPGKVKYRRKGNRANFRCRKSDVYGPKRLDCQSDGTWNGEPPVCIKSGCIPVDITSHDKLDMLESYRRALLTFTCEQGYNLIGAKEAYCDGNKWSAPPPVCTAPTELTECDFEKDLCGWIQDVDDQRDWERNTGPTSTGNTGPIHDHTLGETGSGHYMFFETSQPTENGDVARLISPLYTAEMSPICFDFWYHILGPEDTNHVGSLAVYVQASEEFIDDLQPLFNIEGNKGNSWHRGEITIPQQFEDYQIVIAATRKLSYISDIAIDDVRLFNCTQTTTTTIPETTVTTAIPTVTTTANANQTSGSILTSSKAADVTTTMTVSTVSTVQTKPSQPNTSSKQSSSVTTFSIGSTKTTTTTGIRTTISPTATIASTTVTASTRPTTTVTSKPTTTTLATTETTQPLPTTKPTTKQTTKKTSKLTNAPKQTSPTPTTQTTRATTTKKPMTSPEVTTTVAPTTRKMTTTIKATTIATMPTTAAARTSRKPTSPVITTAATPALTTTMKRTPKTTAVVTTTVPSTTSTTVAPSTTKRTSKPPTAMTSTRKTPKQTTNQTSTPAASTVVQIQTTNARTTETTLSNKITTKTPQTGSTNKVTVTSHPNAIDENTTTNQTVSVSQTREKHPEDDTLKPLMIGLGVGVVSGLIIIGAVVWLCVRRRKLFYTQMSEDELKPITHAGSSHSLNNLDFYQDEELFETNS